MKKLIITLTLLILAGCVRTTVLKNGYSKAPTNPKVFKNKAHFDKSILTQIDTTVIYEEYDTYYNVLERNNKTPDTIYGVYRFYGNGCYNLFNLDRDKPELTKEMFDPSYTGWRGVLYKKKERIFGDLITQVSGMGWDIGKQTQEFSIKGDTLIVEEKKIKRFYIKRRLDKELLNHKANW